jgi:hypothetical protein
MPSWGSSRKLGLLCDWVAFGVILVGLEDEFKSFSDVAVFFG